jgi:N-acetyl sugar amidotransferase
VIYCSKCVYPQVSVNLELVDGVCTACKTSEAFEAADEIFWNDRRKIFEELIHEVKCRPNRNKNYDCIIPVSGGKDSYYQAHVIAKEYGLKPLLVTYHGNNYLPEGDYNRDRMREVFDADHLVFGPSVEVLKKLNRIAFKKMGDMNWHAHCGIFTYPVRISVAMNIPLVVWGEIAWDISGMYHPDDFVEFSARTRHEHGLRGFEWDSMVSDSQNPLTEQDLNWAKYPEDSEILEVGTKGIYIGNFFKWDPNKHAGQMINTYGWKPAQKPFERTYRTVSNLDDRYENGIHDLLKFVKFGYGRASDHASKDIRAGIMSREEGIRMVQKYDHVVSEDLDYWLKYVDLSKKVFWEIADSFRDPRVWWIQDGEWWKENIWGQASSYGKSYLDESQAEKYNKELRNN